ncbi:MAG: GntR family transcriptional regulator [Lentisphaerae bacterium]|nr:GntR family transcriptional regulator [Lentisphaerota bacterium]
MLEMNGIICYIPEKQEPTDNFIIMPEKKQKRTELARKLQQDIYSKELRAGDSIGSIRRLAMRYHTTPLTISRMLNDLVDTGILCRDKKGSCRVLTDPPTKPHLGYAGVPLLPSSSMECLMQDAVRKCFNELDRLGVPPEIIGYHELSDPEIVRTRLKNINGLIFHDSFLDEKTSLTLSQLNIPIVRVGQALPKYSKFSSSEVVQFFDPALQEFARYCDLKSYRRIVIVYSLYWNSIRLAKTLKHFLHDLNADDRLEMMAMPKNASAAAELYAFCHFRKLDGIDWNDTLLISTSGYFSRGICRALADRGELPDILSIDNLDGYEKSTFFEEPYLTAIDRCMGRIFRDAARLLYDQVKSGDERKVIIKVPAKLIIRKSIRHINPEWKER